ncbi:MAG: M66 family metalloprotease [Myxococcota bacterium]
MAKFKTQSGVALAVALGSGCYVGHPDASDLAVGGTEFADSNDDDGTGGGVAEDDGPPDETGDDGPGGGDSPDDGDDGADDGAPSDDDGVPQDDGGTDDGTLPPPGDLASGIAFTDVQLNQGVVIEIVREGTVLSAAQRNADIIDGRAALVRGLFVTDGGFAPRTLEGRLIIRNGDASEAFSDVRQVNGDADASELEGGFLWEVPTGAIGADAEFSLEILETDDTIDGASAEGGARVPVDGTTSLQTASGEHTLRIVIVPLAYGNLSPDLSAANKETLEAALYEQNPVTDLDISYRELTDYPFAVNNGNQLGDVLGFLGNLKSQDGAGNEVYYAGVINIGCFVVGCGNAGTTGIGYIPSAQSFASTQRVSANVWFNAESSSQTVVHETGHNQGLNHVACPQASSSGVDPAYPYGNGQVGGWGWGALSGEFHGSNSYDYMSYCGPSWVSDWTWSKTQSRIEALSSQAAPPSGGALLGHLYPDGTQTWFQTGVPADSSVGTSGVTIALQRDGKTEQVVPAAEGQLSEDGGRWVLAPLPTGLDFDAFELRDSGEIHTIDAGKIRFSTR